MRLLIIYHTGVGNTKMVAERIKRCFEEAENQVYIFSLDQLPETILYSEFDGIVIGFPTIHTHPTKRILHYIDSIDKLEKPMPAFIFTTCGLYSANTVRIFCRKSLIKNLIPIKCASYRCAATDGVLIAPYIKFIGKPEKYLEQKILKDCMIFIDKLKNGKTSAHIPRFKFYSIINYPNKVVGQHITFPIYLHKSQCTKCGKCINDCPSKALVADKESFPQFDRVKCEKCYRCIHHCLNKALSLSKREISKVTIRN